MACQQVANGFRCEKDKIITFTSPNDPSNPLISHNWTIDGVQVSTAAQFTQTFPATGNHTLVHSGVNSCGSNCSQTNQLEIADTVTAPSAAAAGSNMVLLGVGAVVFIGLFALAMKKK